MAEPASWWVTEKLHCGAVWLVALPSRGIRPSAAKRRPVAIDVISKESPKKGWFWDFQLLCFFFLIPKLTLDFPQKTNIVDFACLFLIPKLS